MTTTRLDWALLLSIALHAALLVSFATSGGLWPGIWPGTGSAPGKRPLNVRLPTQPASPADFYPSAALLAGAPRTSRAGTSPAEAGGFPSPLTRIEPEYPEAAFALGISGKVEVDVWVDASGQVENAFVVSSTLDGVFNRSALKAVREARFAPRLVQGKPTRGVYRAVIVYALK